MVRDLAPRADFFTEDGAQRLRVNTHTGGAYFVLRYCQRHPGQWRSVADASDHVRRVQGRSTSRCSRSRKDSIRSGGEPPLMDRNLSREFID